jgi:DNA-binding IclR family transcriptional regulator
MPMRHTKFSENKSLEYSSVQKAIAILLSFIPDNKPTGTLELSEKLGFNKSTVSRLIQVLVHFGLVQQDDQSKKYLLGRTAAMLGLAVEGSQFDRLIELSRTHIERLRDTVGESVCLEAILSGRTKVMIQAIGPPPLSVTFEDFLPIHAAAGAKAMLAFMDPDVVENILNGELEKMTEDTFTDIESLKKHLEEVKRLGLAYDHGEANKDVHAVSVPVFNHLERPVAAITICVPSGRVNKILNNKVAAELKETARHISEQLLPAASE